MFKKYWNHRTVGVMVLVRHHKGLLMDVYSRYIRVPSNWLVGVVSSQVSNIMSSRLKYEMTIVTGALSTI